MPDTNAHHFVSERTANHRLIEGLGLVSWVPLSFGIRLSRCAVMKTAGVYFQSDPDLI